MSMMMQIWGLKEEYYGIGASREFLSGAPEETISLART